ncbi:hypothetical protein C0989_001783 [Termitomyces sp. Mn162]|nr:hypothetical protein C0989_001783 [Termitomyces sp. Mn162]
MGSGASPKVSSLITALDNSYVAAGAPGSTPTKPSTPMRQSSLQPGSTQGTNNCQNIQQALDAHAMQRHGILGNMANVKESAGQFSRRPAVHNQTSHVNFSLNYDFQTPLRTIDFGGPDQEQRMAEFVTKSIDNLSHGLTVKKAMQSLGLKECVTSVGFGLHTHEDLV